MAPDFFRTASWIVDELSSYGIGSRILRVLPQHIPAFFIPAFYTYSVPHYRITALPFFTNTLLDMAGKRKGGDKA